jgi:hypothetical protein
MDDDDDELMEMLRNDVDEVQQMDGDFQRKKHKANVAKKAKGSGAGKGRAPPRPGAVQQRTVATRDVTADKKVRDVHFSVFPHVPSEENTGKHGGLLIVMHATTNTVVENGKVQMAATALDQQTVELRWHEREDRMQTLLLVQPNADGSNAELVRNTQHFLVKVRGVFGLGYGELDAYTDDVRSGQVGVHTVVIKATEPIDTDTNHWAVLGQVGDAHKDKVFMIPYSRTVKTAVGEFGLDV